MSPKKSAAWLMRGSVTHSPRSNATRSVSTPTGARNAPITDDGRYLELQRRLQLRNLASSSPIQLSSKPISRMYHTDLPSCPILCILYISITTSRLNSEQCTWTYQTRSRDLCSFGLMRHFTDLFLSSWSQNETRFPFIWWHKFVAFAIISRSINVSRNSDDYQTNNASLAALVYVARRGTMNRTKV